VIEIFWLAQRMSDVPTGDDWLGPAECEALGGLRVPKRRADWRLGRWTAKRALRSCPLTAAAVSAVAHDDVGGAPSAPASPGTSVLSSLPGLEIAAAEDGAPEARFGGRTLGLTLSLSHSGDRSLAVIAPAGIAVGCDVEKIEPRSEHFVRDYFTAAEVSTVAGVLPGARETVTTLIWGAKESALKALRVGLRFDTRSVHVSLPKTGITDSWQPIAVANEKGGRGFQGWSRQVNGFIEVVVYDADGRQASLRELAVVG
jgi:4'-phosphopantetheinyl transferase